MRRIDEEKVDMAFRFVHDLKTGAIQTDGNNAETVIALLGLMNEFVVWELEYETGGRK